MLLIVTRPQAQAVGWVQALQDLGAQAQALPLIDIAAPDEAAPLHAAWQALASLDLVMFVSANAVAHFFAHASAGSPWPAALRAAATGPGTAAALRQAGVAQIVAPPADATSFDSEALWAQLRGQAWRGRRVLVVRGDEGRDWFAQTLRDAGAEVSFVRAYRRRVPALDGAAQALLQRALALPQQHLWLFSSSQAVAHLRTLAPQAAWAGSSAIASHARIAQAAREAGFGRVVASMPDPQQVAHHAAAWASIQSRTS